MPTPTREFLQRLERQRDGVRASAEGLLMECRAQGREELNQGELLRYKQMLSDLRGLESHIQEYRSDLSRIGNLPAVGPERRGGLSTAGRLAPLHFADEEMRRLQTAAQRGESCRIESRSPFGMEQRDPGFSTADGLLPAELFPFPVEFVHEDRLLDKLPGYAIEAPSVTFIRHVSTTGAAAPVAEGVAKPEVVFNTNALTAAAVKLAAHNGLSWEIINDWPAFQSYAGTELYRQIIDVENSQLLSGSGTGGSMTGFYSTSGILTFDASTVTTTPGPWDSLEHAIATLRTGPALAVPNLLVLHPNTWSAIRRQTNTYGDYYVASDPSTDQVGQAWGVPVVSTTANPAGKGLLLDTSKFGYIAIRESLSMRLGYSGTDLVQNILRTVAEERLVLCVTRPAAVLAISNLPLS
jgi:hypothetical protein